jgi:hypothetical protein
MEYLKVEDHKDLIRDKKSKAILNKDAFALNKYREERAHRLKVATVVEEHQQIKNDIALIKEMLTKLLGKV